MEFSMDQSPPGAGMEPMMGAVPGLEGRWGSVWGYGSRSYWSMGLRVWPEAAQSLGPLKPSSRNRELRGLLEGGLVSGAGAAGVASSVATVRSALRRASE